jgi:hypothetical protein
MPQCDAATVRRTKHAILTMRSERKAKSLPQETRHLAV